MSRIVIGNIIAFIASLVMVYSGTLKDKKEILLVQIVEIFMFIISQVILRSISGIIMNTVNIIGHILYYFGKLKILPKVFISVISVVVTVLSNNLGWIGFLPLIGVLAYLWLIDLKNIIHFKLLIIFVLLLWSIHDYSIQSYTSAIFDIATIIASFVSIYRIYDSKKKGIEITIEKKDVV